MLQLLNLIVTEIKNNVVKNNNVSLHTFESLPGPIFLPKNLPIFMESLAPSLLYTKLPTMQLFYTAMGLLISFNLTGQTIEKSSLASAEDVDLKGAKGDKGDTGPKGDAGANR